MKPQVSIVIVHYQNRRLLYRCLDSLKQARPQPAFETIVVDNDETPTIEKALKRKFPRVKYVKSPGNVGYAAGNNDREYYEMNWCKKVKQVKKYRE